MSWSRETRWRQGGVLLARYFSSLDINGADFDFALAITHDCDIANDNLAYEPNVEFILGNFTSGLNGNNTLAKNPRVLHIEVQGQDGLVSVEILAANKISVSKEKFNSLEPDGDFILNGDQVPILRDWLASRYRRQAFPDSFNSRLSPVTKFLENQGKRNLHGVIGYWLDYQPRDVDLADDENYELWLYIVYSSEDDRYENAAIGIASALKEKFPGFMGKNGAGRLVLRECEAYSEHEFTLNDMRSSVQYRTDHISHRESPPEPVV